MPIVVQALRFAIDSMTCDSEAAGRSSCETKSIAHSAVRTVVFVIGLVVLKVRN